MSLVEMQEKRIWAQNEKLTLSKQCISGVILHHRLLGPKQMLGLKTSNGCPVPWMPCYVKAGEEVNIIAECTWANHLCVFLKNNIVLQIKNASE